VTSTGAETGSVFAPAFFFVPAVLGRVLRLPVGCSGSVSATSPP
jgi:hypothetical protein